MAAVAQTITPEGSTAALGEPFTIEYTDAPEGAVLVAWPYLKSINDQVVEVALTAGSGSADIVIPTEADLHGYYVQMAKKEGDGYTALSNRVGIAGSNSKAEMKITGKSVFPVGEMVEFFYENLPACPKDWFGIYPVPNYPTNGASDSYVYPTAYEHSGSIYFPKALNEGYYRVYYCFEDNYMWVYDPWTVAVGTPASVSAEVSFLSPGKDVVLNYSNLNPFNDFDRIAVYKKGVWVEDEEPLWVSDVLEEKSGQVTIPGGTLGEGMYCAYVLFEGLKQASSQASDFTLSAAADVPPALSIDTRRIKFGDEAFIKYTNAPDGARICIYAKTDNFTLPTRVIMNLEGGEGEVAFSLPEGLNNGTFYAEMYTTNGIDSAIISNRIEFLADNIGGGFTLESPRAVYQLLEPVQLNYTNAPNCDNDWFGIYPVGYLPNTPKEDPNWQTSSAWAYVNGQDGTSSFNAPSQNGYYAVWYLLENKYETIADPIYIAVGRPAKNAPTKQQYALTEDIVVKYSNLSGVVTDWIGVFEEKADFTVDKPLFTFQPEGAKEGEFCIEAGKLPAGQYKVVCFYAGTQENISTPAYFKVAGTLDLLLVEAQRALDSTYYYTIDENAPLITMADDGDDENNQFFCNAKETSDATAYANLIDQNADTYFYSKWNGVGPEEAHYLQVDLREQPVSAFKFKFTVANYSGGWGQRERWKNIVVYASNDRETWTEITQINNLPTDEDITEYFSPGIDLKEKYRYVRFEVKNTVADYINNGQVRFVIGDFQMYEATRDEANSQCEYDPDLKEACNLLRKAMDKAKAELADNTVTDATVEALMKAINDVRALIAHPELLTDELVFTQEYLDFFTVGTDYGQVDEESHLALQNVVANISDYNPLRLTVKDIYDKIATLEAAIDEFEENIISFVVDKWYYIVNTDKRRSGVGSIYNTKVFGNAIYPLSSNLEDENFVGDIDGLTIGCYDEEEEMLTETENPYLMWKIVPVDEEEGTYAFLNRATGTYMGALYNHEANYHGMSLTPVPYFISHLGPGQFEMICQDEKNTMQTPVHASGDGVLKAWEDGGYDGASSWTFVPVDENLDAISIEAEYNSIMAYCLPYAVSDLAEINSEYNVATYAVKNMPDAETLELTKKSSFEAGEPFILVCGNPEEYDEENILMVNLLSYAPQECILKPQPANGLVSTLPFKHILRKSGYGYFDGYGLKATADVGISIDAHSAYLDPTLIQDAGTAVDLTLKVTNGKIDGVKTLINQTEQANRHIYTIDGKLVGNKTADGKPRSLQKGIYIIGKKKVAVK